MNAPTPKDYASTGYKSNLLRAPERLGTCPACGHEIETGDFFAHSIMHPGAIMHYFCLSWSDVYLVRKRREDRWRAR